ncbi:Amino acid permease OS=Streptomyces tendae OX=1932 GN=GUR47_09290 PE=3 SV=1 [Streptomyces tendae]
MALFVWLVICFSQLRMRRIIQAEAPEKLVVRMWLFPYLTWAAAALIVFVLGYMLTDTEHDGRTTVLLSLLVAALVLVVAFVKQRIAARGAVAGKG